MKNMHLSLILIAFSLFSNCSKKEDSNPSPVETNPKISVNDISLTEKNTGTTPFAFKISLDKASSKTVTVNYTTVEGYAKSNEDFMPSAASVTFAPNETQKTINIEVIADDLREATEDFALQLSGVVNASISKAIGTAMIQNDDSRVSFTNSGYEAPTSYPGYSLVWADEFNGTTLNTSDWNFENGDGCPNNCGWGNNELEYYTGRADNLFFQDGKMIIEARKEPYSGKEYTSSKILTRDKKIFKFGRIDFRAKLPKGKGIWPAFWMMPQENVFGGWPRSGELDIMEMIGHEANKTHGTLHFGPGPGSIQLGGSYTLPSGIFNDEFHVFSLEWKQDEIKWLLDGNVFSTHTIAEFGSNNYPFNENFYFIINLAVGGNWPGNPDGTTVFPQWYIIDYLRVYQ